MATYYHKIKISKGTSRTIPSLYIWSSTSTSGTKTYQGAYSTSTTYDVTTTSSSSIYYWVSTSSSTFTQAAFALKASNSAATSAYYSKTGSTSTTVTTVYLVDYGQYYTSDTYDGISGFYTGTTNSATSTSSLKATNNASNLYVRSTVVYSYCSLSSGDTTNGVFYTKGSDWTLKSGSLYLMPAKWGATTAEASTSYTTQSSTSACKIYPNTTPVKRYGVKATKGTAVQAIVVSDNETFGQGNINEVSSTYNSTTSFPQYTDVFLFVVANDQPPTGYKYKNQVATSGSSPVLLHTSLHEMTAAWNIGTVNAPMEKLTYTVTLAINPSGYGSWEKSTTSYTVEYGTAVSISGDTITIGSNTNSAIPAGTSAQYTYAFTGFTAPSTITSNTTIYANFSRTTRTYTVSFSGTYGTWSTTSVSDVPYGTAITRSGNTVTLGSGVASSTFTPNTTTVQYDYSAPSFSVPTSITGATTITGSCTRTNRLYTIKWIGADGSTALETDSDVKYADQALTYNGATPTKSSTAQYSYSFAGWRYGSTSGTAVTSGTSTLQSVGGGSTSTTTLYIYAVFNSTVRNYTVSFAISPSGYGSWNSTTAVTAPYGTTIDVKDNKVTINTTTAVTRTATAASATAQYTYAFSSISAVSSVTGDTTITANFTATTNKYTVSFSGTNGTWSSSSIANVPYGTSVTRSGNTVTVGSYGSSTFTKNSDTVSTVYANPTFTNDSGTISGARTITGSSAASTRTYTVSGTSTNGVVTFSTSSSGTYSASITAAYGATIYYKITPNNYYYYSSSTYTHNNPYSTSIVLNNTNFTCTTSNNTATKAFSACSSFTFTVSGTSSNGTVTWSTSSSGTYTSSISRLYGETAYWKITPNTGYSAPSPATGNYAVNSSNFTISSAVANATATKALAACTINSYAVTFTKGNYLDSIFTSTSSSATSGNASGTTYQYNSTVYCIITLPANDAQYTYTAPSGWTNVSGTRRYYKAATVGTSGVAYGTVSATRTTNTYTVTFSGTYGTWSVGSQTGVPYGAAVTREGNTIKINGVAASVFTPNSTTVQYNYSAPSYTGDTGSITGATTISGSCTRTDRTYTIYWVDGNGSTVETDTSVKYTDKLTYNGSTPTKTSTAQYSYTFSAWKYGSTSGSTVTSGTSTLSSLSGGSTSTTSLYIYATFTSSVRNYTVSFAVNTSGYGSWNSTTALTVPYGTAIETTSAGNSVVIGTTTRTATATAATTQYTYAFVNFTNGDTTVVGNTTITANFSRTTNKYYLDLNPKVTVVDLDGSSTTSYGSGYSGLTFSLYLNGSSTATATNVTDYYTQHDYGTTYKFVNTATPTETGYTWTKAADNSGTITGTTSAEPVATKTRNSYTISFTNPTYGSWGTTSKTANYGDKITRSGNTVTCYKYTDGTTVRWTNTLTAKSTDYQYTYSATASGDNITSVTAAATFGATSSRTDRYYTVTYRQVYNGSVLNSTTASTIHDATVKASDKYSTTYNTAQYYYSGGTDTSKTVTGATTVDMTYSSRTINNYTVTFTATNGSWTSASITVPYGTSWSTNGLIVTLTDTSSSASNTYTKRATTVDYTSGDATISPTTGTVTSNVTITGVTATSARTYTIKWIGADGSTALETDSSVGYNATLTYNSSTPTKAATDQYTYSFANWRLNSTSGNVVTSGTTKNPGSTSSTTINIYSTFSATERSYTVTLSGSNGSWKNSGGTVVSSATGLYSAGVSASGTTLTIGSATYTWNPTAKSYYSASGSISGASGTVGTGKTVTGSTTYIAYNYTIQQKVITGGTVYWSTSSITTSGGSTTLSAQYGSTVYWRIAANTEYNLPSTYYGSMVLNDTNFTISSTTASGNATYKGSAIGNCTRKTFTITFSGPTYGRWDDGIITDTVYYGDKISTSGTTVTCYKWDATTTARWSHTAIPTPNTTQYSYSTPTITGGSITSVTANATITATNTRTVNNYTINFAISPSGYGSWDNATAVSVPYGTEVETNGTNQIVINTSTAIIRKASAASTTTQYTYAFKDYTNGSFTVTGNATITANFTRTTRTYTVSGSSTNGVVTVCATQSGTYASSVSLQYGATVYYKITPNNYYYYSSSTYTHSNPYASNLAVTTDNFSFNTSSMVATKSFSVCSPFSYKITGTSAHGTVTWCATSSGTYTADITINYGSTAYWKIAPNTGYEINTGSGSYILNSTNFTISSAVASGTATKTLASCTAKSYTVTKGQQTNSSISVASSGTFDSPLSITITKGSATGYIYNDNIDYAILANDTVIKSGTATSGTAFTWTMTGTYYSGITISSQGGRTPKQYTITLAIGNGSTAAGPSGTATAGTATATYDSNVIVINTAPTATDSVLNGYYTTTEATTKIAYVAGGLIANISGFTDANGKWIKDSNATIYSNWTPNAHKITFDVKGGSAIEQQISAYLPNPFPTTRDSARTFIAWYNSDYTTKQVAGTRIYDDITIYAQWYNGNVWQAPSSGTGIKEMKKIV